RSAGTSEGAAMDSLLPRTGLQFYMEVRGAGLAQIAQSGGAAGPLMKLVARPAFGSAGDLAAFAAAQMGTLSRAKLAFVSYGAEGSAALIEAANAAAAESLRGGVSRLITRSSNSRTRGQTKLKVALAGRTVVAGQEELVGKLLEPGDVTRLGGDPLFVRARERFSSDPLFAYMEMGTPQLPGPSSA